MANYTIIGGDGKEYGPVTEADIRLWVSEGRLNAQSLAKADGDAEFRPLGLYPELANLFAPTPGGVTPGSIGPVPTEGDYDLDIGACVSRSWAVFKANMGILVGAFLLYLLMIFAGSFVIGLIANSPGQSWPGEVARILLQVVVASLFVGPLTGGLYTLMLRVLRGESGEVGDLFAGFQNQFSQLYFGQLVITAISSVCFLPTTLIFTAKLTPLLLKMQGSPAPDQMQVLLHQMMAVYSSAAPVMLACLIPAMYFQVSLMYALPLIIDRQLKAGAAIKTSWKMTNRHWWHVFGLFIVSGLIGISGVLACCVGVFFTLPLGTLILLVAYESIFLRKKA